MNLIMTPPQTTSALNTLIDDEPTYKELIELYNKLRASPTCSNPEAVSQRALAQIIGEFIDYLDFVESELEKSVGISRSNERNRILNSFSETTGDNPLEDVACLIQQWENMERYTPKDVVTSIEDAAVESEVESNTRSRSRNNI